MIKNIYAAHLLKPLCHIINLSFTLFKLPLDWKISVVTPVIKTDSRLETTNYRPISLINNFAKIFEKCLKCKIVNLLEKHNILYEKQYGFINGRRTEDAMYDLINNINNNLQENKKSLAVFLDLSKAFDSVSHEILFERLKKIGIRNGPLDLFKNYLSNREQFVKIHETISDPQSIKTGVPQGTVLGSLLFLIYVNDMGYLLDKGKII